MEHNFGNEFAVRRRKGSTIALIRLGGLALTAALIAGGIYFISNPIDPEDTIFGYVALGVSIIILIASWIIANRMKGEVAIHEEGVIVKKGNKTHKYHFNDIAGLQDQAGDVTTVLVGGGLIGAIGAGIAAGVTGAAKNAINRKNRNRPMNIVTKSVSQPGVSVLKSAGDILSEVFTGWFIKNNGITKEALQTMELSFGDKLKLKDGEFVYSRRKSDVNLPITGVTNTQIIEDSLMLYGLNEKGKDKCLISVNIVHVLNIDLLFKVIEMAELDE